MYVGLFMKHKMFEVYLALYTTIGFKHNICHLSEFILIVNEMNFHIILDETRIDKIPNVITFILKVNCHQVHNSISAFCICLHWAL